MGASRTATKSINMKFTAFGTARSALTDLRATWSTRGLQKNMKQRRLAGLGYWMAVGAVGLTFVVALRAQQPSPSAVSPAATSPVSVDSASQRAVVNRYCISCHNE